MSIVLAIPDLHAPFHNKKTIPFLRYVYRHYKCNKIVCLGDEMDFHGLSRFPKNPDGYAAGLEWSLGLSFLKELFREFPNVDVCISNHTARPYRVAYEHGIPNAMLKGYKELLSAPVGWNWHQSILIDDVVYIHGEGFSGANAHTKAAIAQRRSTVIGHIHSNAGVHYMQGIDKRIFGLNAGCLIDTEAYAFEYGKVFPQKPVIGCGLIVNGTQAYFIPMEG